MVHQDLSSSPKKQIRKGCHLLKNKQQPDYIYNFYLYRPSVRDSRHELTKQNMRKKTINIWLRILGLQLIKAKLQSQERKITPKKWDSEKMPGQTQDIA